jgi:hypothetical protein
MQLTPSILLAPDKTLSSKKMIVREKQRKTPEHTSEYRS